MNYFKLTTQELGKDAKIAIKKLGDSGEVFYELALEMINLIEEKNAAGENSVIICPVGPVGHYPIFARLVNEKRLSLKNTWFINLDEYLDDNDNWIDIDHPLSFRGFMNKNVYSQIDPELVMPESQRIFPSPADPDAIGKLIAELGGVDLAVGGIGINGHLAFNEPNEAMTGEEFAAQTTRVLDISRETRTINSVGDLGGAIDLMPKRCVTLGMKEILESRKVRLGVFRDWHRAVVRQTAYGEKGAHFPATLLQGHPDAMIIANSVSTGNLPKQN